MTPPLFTEKDLSCLKERSLDPERVLRQVGFFQHEPPAVRLDRPATPGDGIHIIPEAGADEYLALHQQAGREGRFVKFVPASGAATRMFDPLLKRDPEAVERFVRELRRFAFRDDLAIYLDRRGGSLEDPGKLGDASQVAQDLVMPSGLDLAHLPKGLLKFHSYPDGPRTALEEHLVEAVLYARNTDGACRLHFTVLPGHRPAFEEFFARVRSRYERKSGARIAAEFSVQKPSTETLAVDLENRPFRDARGNLVFRPGGHGALLENLKDLNGEVVFIKNIDNVVPDRLKETTVRWKKILAGVLVKVQAGVFGYLRALEKKDAPEAWMDEASSFCRRWFFRDPLENVPAGPDRLWALARELDRPLRVCGMVRNTGEPGGGPYWVRDPDGRRSLQIIEGAQVDLSDASQKSVFTSSTHFNPVDLVCGLKGPGGRPYDLSRYVDENAVIISRKTLDGKLLKALEWPGLWNGSMHGWNTVFVEVPVETFNPVKTVFDLLRPQHQS